MANWIKTVAKVLVLPLGILLVLLALKCYTKKLAANEETQKQIEEDAMDIELDINDTARELAELMQSDLHELQNPKNCTSARKLFCTSNNGNPCGFACFTHHVLHCFMVAYWTRRTFVLETKDWNYSKDKGQKGWGTVFLPLSNTCTTVTAEEAVLWSGDHEDHQVVSVPDIFHIDPKPTFLPQSIPKKIAEKLTTFHEDPFAWFAGQFLSYLMRPNAELKKYISTKKKSMGITKPYAGIHVRRTDKLLLEAKKHSLEEYMIHVENWYQSYGKDYKVDKKRVFIATDDPSVIKEARDKYSEYEVYGDENIVQSAKPESRYSFNSLLGIVYDIFVLAESDFVVCTFSSNIGRLVYEFMQSFHTNAAKKCHSVDDPTYYFYVSFIERLWMDIPLVFCSGHINSQTSSDLDIRFVYMHNRPGSLGLYITNIIMPENILSRFQVQTHDVIGKYLPEISKETHYKSNPKEANLKLATARRKLSMVDGLGDSYCQIHSDTQCSSLNSWKSCIDCMAYMQNELSHRHFVPSEQAQLACIFYALQPSHLCLDY